MLVPRIAFLLTWGLVNFVWLVLLRRPAVAAALSLVLVVVLILLSRFKHDVLIMTANFLDVMMIDSRHHCLPARIFPNLVPDVIGLAARWCCRCSRCCGGSIRSGCGCVRRRFGAVGLSCRAGGAFIRRADRSRQGVRRHDYVSQFARSGAVAVIDVATHGFLESDSASRDHLSSAPPAKCTPSQRLPHIVMVLDELSFDISVVPGVKVPPGYQSHFRSFDGKSRTLLVEGAGGPTWYTEYNVLTGLSVRSYGRFADFVTRIAAGRVTRSLPNALRNCGYRTYSVYPWLGAFLSARNFQKTLGIDHFYDAKDLKTREVSRTSSTTRSPPNSSSATTRRGRCSFSPI